MNLIYSVNKVNSIGNFGFLFSDKSKSVQIGSSVKGKDMSVCFSLLYGGYQRMKEPSRNCSFKRQRPVIPGGLNFPWEALWTWTWMMLVSFHRFPLSLMSMASLICWRIIFPSGLTHHELTLYYVPFSTLFAGLTFYKISSLSIIFLSYLSLKQL